MDLQYSGSIDFFHKTLVIDIETVPAFKNLDGLSPEMQQHWIHKSSFLKLTEEEVNNSQLSYSQRAGIYAEFGKIVCIGLGIFNKNNDGYFLRLKAISNDDENTLLRDFYNIVANMEKQYRSVIFCGHNIKEFDLPFICRRFLVNNIDLPQSLQLSGKKPWEIEHQDTLEL